MSEKGQRPGVMVYFEIRPAIQRLSLQERGELFTAILDYSEFGIVSDLDGMVGLCFDLIRPKIDRDAAKYEKVSLDRKYAVYCREADRNNQPKMGKEQWLEQYHVLSPDNQGGSTVVTGYPTAPATAATSSTAPATAAISPAVAESAPRRGTVEGCWGDGEGKPRSPEEVRRILRESIKGAT